MMTLRERPWLTHRRRPDWNLCPLCQAPIKWIYDGIVWIPCDREPVLVYPRLGRKRAVVRRELLEDCAYYANGPIAGETPVLAHEPHIFTCDHLKKE